MCVQPSLLSLGFTVATAFPLHSSTTWKQSTLIVGIDGGLQPKSRTAVPLTAVMVGAAGVFTVTDVLSEAVQLLPSVTVTLILYVWPQVLGMVTDVAAVDWSVVVVACATGRTPLHV